MGFPFFLAVLAVETHVALPLLRLQSARFMGIFRGVSPGLLPSTTLSEVTVAELQQWMTALDPLGTGTSNPAAVIMHKM